MKLIASIFAILLASTCFMSSAEAGGKGRILRGLAKGVLIAKLFKPKLKLLPLPLPLPLPIPIHLKTHAEPVYIAKPEPIVYAEPHYGGHYGGW